jgi:hypothetical protein
MIEGKCPHCYNNNEHKHYYYYYNYYDCVVIIIIITIIIDMTTTHIIVATVCYQTSEDLDCSLTYGPPRAAIPLSLQEYRIKWKTRRGTSSDEDYDYAMQRASAFRYVNR